MEWLEVFWKIIITNWPWILSVGVPFVVALIAKCDWSSDAKGWLAAVMSCTIGIVGAFAAGLVFTPSTFVLFATSVYGTTQLAYKIFRNFGITSKWLDDLLAFGSKTPLADAPVELDPLPTYDETGAEVTGEEE